MTEVISAVSSIDENTRAIIVADYCDRNFDKPSAKSLENRDSISSVDSNISLSYDAAPFTPRTSIQIAAPLATTAVRSSSSSGNDSASGTDAATNKPCSDEEPPFVPPDNEQAKRIVDQVEYYFSDENIVKDAFLLKHVRRNKEGYVSLKLIASFKRVKHVARDWRAVRHALRHSTKLEVNETGTKLRRREPLPSFDQTTPSRTVVVVHLPAEQTTVESVAEMYRECGEIASIRVLRPGNQLPADVRLFYNRHPEVHDSTNALVEFVRTESAHSALNREPTAGSAIRVLELNAPAAISKKKPPTKKIYRNVVVGPTAECVSSAETEDRYRPSQPLQSHVMTITAQQQQHIHHLQQKHNLIEQSYHPQRRWSRDSGMDSPTSCGSRSRSNSGAYATPERRLSGSGWDENTPPSGRSRSNSGVSIPDAFHMRRYSLPRHEPAPTPCCCCEHGAGSGPTNGRRYSLGRDDGYGGTQHPLSWRVSSGENVDGPYRKDSLPEYYTLRRDSVTAERRPSVGRTCNASYGVTAAVRRLSDPDGRLNGLVRQRSINSMQGALGHGTDMVVRLPRGPDGGRGFQREIIEYALPE